MEAASAQGYLRQLLDLCSRATSSVVVAAPFIKADVLRELIAATHENVEVTVVTRWRVDEIVVQVSDLDVWPIVRDRAHSRLLLQQRLHAKYYRADRECLIGSANVTATALAGNDSGNLELMVTMAAADPQLNGVEERLLSGTIQVDEGLYNRFMVLTAGLLPEPSQAVKRRYDAQPPAEWYPRFRLPAELYRVYQGSDDYSSEVLQAAQQDLVALAPPSGLGRAAFEAAVGIALQTTSLVRALDSLLGTEERRFGELQDWVSEQTGRPDDEGRATQTIVRWVLTFLPDRYQYRRPGYSELLSRRVRGGGP